MKQPPMKDMTGYTYMASIDEDTLDETQCTIKLRYSFSLLHVAIITSSTIELTPLCRKYVHPITSLVNI